MSLLQPIQRDSLDANLLIGQIDFNQGNRGTARDIAADVIRADPANAPAYNLLGLVDLTEGVYDSALQNFETAAGLNPNLPDFQLNLARVHLARNDREAARAVIAKARLAGPNSIQLMALETVLFTRDADYVRAEHMLEALDTAGFDPGLRLVLVGELREAQGEFVAAAEAYEAAYTRQPSLLLAMRASRAQQAAGLEDPTNVLVDWIDRSPEDVIGLKALVAWHLGREEFQTAQQYLERLVAIDQEDWAALNDLAWIYDEANDDRALQTAQRAYGLEPANPAIADTLGWIHLKSGNTESALKLLNEAADKMPQHPEIQYHLAIAYRDSGDVASARQILTGLVQTNQTFPSRQAAEQALAKL